MFNEMDANGEKTKATKEKCKIVLNMIFQQAVEEDIIYDRTKDVKLVQSAAGHTTAAMTMKHYVKGRSSNQATAEAIADAYGLQPVM